MLTNDSVPFNRKLSNFFILLIKTNDTSDCAFISYIRWSSA